MPRGVAETHRIPGRSRRIKQPRPRNPRVGRSDEKLSENSDVLSLFLGQGPIRGDHALHSLKEKLSMFRGNRCGIEPIEIRGHIQPAVDLEFLTGVEVQTADQPANKGALLRLNFEIRPGKRTDKTH